MGLFRPLTFRVPMLTEKYLLIVGFACFGAGVLISIFLSSFLFRMLVNESLFVVWCCKLMCSFSLLKSRLGSGLKRRFGSETKDRNPFYFKKKKRRFGS